MTNVLPVGIRYRLFDRRASHNRRTAAVDRRIGEKSAGEYYWDLYRAENKIEVADFISERFAQDRLSIFEFGCHCGNVLRLLDETLKANLVYTGLDPNSTNLEFARQKFNSTRHSCSFVLGDETNLAELNQDKMYDLYIISSVFYCMSPREVRLVLANAYGCSRHLLIADDISSVDRRSTTLDKCFRHPYRNLLREAGFEIVVQRSFAHPQVAYSGILLAVPQRDGRGVVDAVVI
jgi:SAM-dependent methyltransferase